MNDAERISMHFKYCSLILIMVIIAIATDRWTAQKDFTTYLSNAATMTSLLLGLVAIFYSFISNDGLSKSLGSITTVSAEVRDAREEIGRYLGLTKEATQANSSNTTLLKSASESVNASLATLDVTLQAISEQNRALQTLVGGLPTRIDQLESKVVDVAKALGEKPTQPQAAASPADIPTRVVERFLARPSLSYNLVTYASVLSARTQKPLSIDALCKAISLDQPNTMNGFLIAMNGMQLLSRALADGQPKVYKITGIHPDLDTKTKPYIVGYLDRYFADKVAEKNEWLRKIENVEALFADPPTPQNAASQVAHAK